MPTNHGFYWNKQIDAVNQVEYIVIGWRDESDTQSYIEAWVTPSHGSNLCRLVVDGENVIDYELGPLLKKDFTGTPVLYPTPNKVRNGIIRVDGRSYPQVVGRERILEHGLVHREAWEYSDPVIDSDDITFHTWIRFEPSKTYFNAFPFVHCLHLNFILKKNGVEVMYTIDNEGDDTIPFGFGLHPYFMKLSGDAGSYVQLPARYVMDYTADLLPTGRCIDVQGTIYDLRQKSNLGMLDLDHVFTGIEANRYAQVEYPDQGIKVDLVATEDFTHLVFYSPRDAPYFCVENQTCSTDAHNLYDRGFHSESGLKFVPPHTSHTGSVMYLITRE